MRKHTPVAQKTLQIVLNFRAVAFIFVVFFGFLKSFLISCIALALHTLLSLHRLNHSYVFHKGITLSLDYLNCKLNETMFTSLIVKAT